MTDLISVPPSPSAFACNTSGDGAVPPGRSRPAGDCPNALTDIDRFDGRHRNWTAWAIDRIEADARRTADTHLLVFPLPGEWGIDLYLKDESSHPTGSLKHRLARSLFLHALCSGQLHASSTVVEASSGSTAVSEAYFARLLGLRFVGVMPSSTSSDKLALIRSYGGRCHLVDDPGTVYAEATRVAAETGGHYLDQFTNADRATDWRGNNNIAESILGQMAMERYPNPEWIVVGAGTGGTSATIGRYLRYKGLSTGLAVVDPEGSSFFPGWRDRDPSVVTGRPSRIEGIGRPRVEPSFVAGVVDRMLLVPDAASVAAMYSLEASLGRRAGPSTGTNLWGAFTLVAEMLAQGRKGSVVSLLCDSGERYLSTYYDRSWLEKCGLGSPAYALALATFMATGRLASPPHTHD